MFSGKSWPNRALLWKDWRLSMPIFVVWASFVTLVSTLTFIYHLVGYRSVGIWIWEEYWHGFSAFHLLLEGSAGWTGMAMVLFIIVLGTVSLGHERERGTLLLLSSMPYARREILLSKVLVGLAQLSLPFVANALLLTVILETNREIHLPFGVAAVWGWAGHSVLVLTFVLCVSLLASAISGKTLGTVFLALVILLFPFGMYVIVVGNGAQWERTGLISHMHGLYWYWQDLVNDAATYLTVPTWLIDFPAVIAANSTAYVNTKVVDLVFANHVWAFLRTHTYVLYLALAGFSLGVYAWAQKWFAASQREHDDELLTLPHLRPLIGTGFTVCSALLGGAILPGLFHLEEGLRQLVMILLSYAGSAILAWMLTRRFLYRAPEPRSGARRKRTVTALLLIVVVLTGILIVAMFGMPRQLSDKQAAGLLELAETVMERRTAVLVSDGTAPLIALSNELANESPELLGREQAAMAQLSRHREALRQQGESYVRSETQLILVGSQVRQNIATIAVKEQSKLYFAEMYPNQPEYVAWVTLREFVFDRHGERWELTMNILLNGKGLPPNEPGEQ